MGWTHVDVDPDENRLEALRAKVKELTDLLEWERQQRAEAQEKSNSLEKELTELRDEATAEASGKLTS